MEPEKAAVEAASGDLAGIITACAEIIKALGALAWPFVIVIVAMIFKSDFRKLFERLSSAEVLGNKFTMGPQLDALEDKAAQASAEVAASLDIEGAGSIRLDPPVIAKAEQETEVDAFVNLVMEEAARNAKLGLMMLSMGLDRLARRIAKARQTPGPASVKDVVVALQPTLPDNLSVALQDFRAIRNRIVHGFEATERDIIRAIDSGILLYRALSNVEVPLFRVVYASVPLFQDEGLQRRLPFHHGIIVETLNQQEPENRRSIWPSRQKFAPGDLIIPSWNFSIVFKTAWYRDPETDAVTQGWGEAAELAGEIFDEDD